MSVDEKSVDPILLTRFHVACEDGDELCVEEFLNSTLDINGKNKSRGDDTALHAACHNCQCDIVSLLLSHGANPEQRNAYGQTPLHVAYGYTSSATSAKKLALVRMLLDRGANVNARDKYGGTALHFFLDEADIVKELLARGATVNAQEKIGCWPVLHAAASYGSLESVQLLLQAGANINASDGCGNTTALDVAYLRCYEIRACLEEALANSWSRKAQREYLDIVIALAPLNLPAYILLWSLDWLPQFTSKPELAKIRLLECVYESRRRIVAQRQE